MKTAKVDQRLTFKIRYADMTLADMSVVVDKD